MDLDLILLGIAALGILALLLIFWGRKPPRKNIPMPAPESYDDVEEENVVEKSEHYISDNFQLEDSSAVTHSDQAFASLGFSAFDDLLGKKAEVAPPIVQAVPETDFEPIQTTLYGREFIVFYLVAPANRPFSGYGLLQALSAVGLKYGEMNIFHQYSDESEFKKSLFSVASATEPGSFDLANIGAISCPGLSLFLKIPNSNLFVAFETMLDVAKQLADDLEGKLCDEDRQPLTAEKIQNYRELIFS